MEEQPVTNNESIAAPPHPRIAWLGLVISALLLAGVAVFAFTHVGEAERFANLLKGAQPWWLLVAVVLQLGTYLCAGGVWGRVATAAGHKLPITQVARLSVEKLSIDQFVPTGGLSGNMVVVRAMRRMGLPSALAAEALIIDILSHYTAFALVAAVAFGILWWHHDVTHVLLVLLMIFAALVAAVPLSIGWLLRHRQWRPGPRLARIRPLTRLLDSLRQVSPRRIRNPALLINACVLQTAIFSLDAGTLWAILHALGVPTDPLTAFVAVVIATIAGMLSLLPGGIGSFEAACTATLALLGVPVEAALTATLLLRGMSLWLPLIPGLLLARGDFAAPLSQTTGTPNSSMANSIGVDPGVPVDELFSRLHSRHEGLTADEANQRLLSTGANMIAPEHRLPGFGEILHAISSPLYLILLTAAVASLFLGEVADAVIIITMVLLGAIVNYWQSLRSARAIRALQARITPTAIVLRDGAFVTVPRAELVVGDVVRLAAGDMVPADARLLETTDLHVQQAALTGESLPVEKRAVEQAIAASGPDAAGLVFVGTSIVSGSAIALVYATGAHTAYGDIAARLAARPEETEFERGSRHFATLILQTVIFLVLFILVVSIAGGRDPFQSLLFAVALAVGLTPEYLPMITTVTLAQGARRMAREKVIVKHLASIQNLGSIDVLCSDKTGTLTSGQMSVAAALDPFGAPNDRTLMLAALNSHFETGVASALDAAILQQPVAGVDNYRKLAEIPFDFERRRLSVVVAGEGRQLLITKGAPESVLACCTHVEVNGAVETLDAERQAACLEQFRRLSIAGYRVLAVACREWNGGLMQRSDERDLVLVGFLSFADQLLPGMDATIQRLRDDGVAVKILTGDNELVTRTLCAKVGIHAERIVTGAELDRMDEPALVHVLQHVDVFARVSPAQKHRIIMALKRHGHVVGYMGDGINDAPSLHGADVGVSVAGAVDVAREASDILLLERRLDVLHAGILAGRHAFANVLKYLFMGTSSNFGNMLSMAGAVLFLPFLPMLPTQILVNNFLYDLAQVTIPTDKVDPLYLRGPQRWNMTVIRKFMLLVGPVSSVFDFITFGVLLWLFKFAESQFQTGWFVESLATQVLVLFVIRTAGRPWRNRPSLPLAATSIGVVTAGLVLPFTPLAAVLGMTPLPIGYFVFVVLVVPTYLVLVELVKRRVLYRVASS